MGSEFDDALAQALVGVADGLELDSTLQRILSSAVDLTGARYGAIGVLSPAGGLAEFRYVGIGSDQAAQIGALPKGLAILGQLIQDPRPLRLDDLAAHPAAVGFPPNHPRMTAFLGMPVKAAGSVFGNIYLTDKPGGFDAADEARLTSLATAAGVAIRNAQLFAAARHGTLWQAAAVDMTRAVLSGEDSGAVLQLLAQRARELSGADLGLVVTSDEVEAFVEVVEAAPGVDHEITLGLTVTDPLVLACLTSRRTESARNHGLIWNPDSAPDRYARVECCSIASADTHVGGLVLLWREAPRQLDTSGVDAVPQLSTQAAIALSLDESRREQERLGLFEDRDRIARDLHDLVVQRLFASGVSLEVIARKAQLPEATVASLQDVAAALDQTIAQIRGTIFELREGTGRAARRLADELADEVDYMHDALGFEVDLDVDEELTVAVQNELLNDTVAVVREGLSNVARHAHATAARVEVTVVKSWYCVTIVDDGDGMGGATRKSGLDNLQQRAQAWGGHCDVVSGHGTTLAWRVPVRHT